jgi:branched-chain amino acid transport system permease protein
VSPDTIAIIALEVLNSITILVLLALGLAVIFGMMRIVNLAQGEFFTAGAFTVLAGIRYAHLPLWLAMLLAPFVVAGIGIAIERLVIDGCTAGPSTSCWRPGGSASCSSASSPSPSVR